MTWHVIELILSLGVILASSVIFTNGVEHLGIRLKLHQGAVGSILAAVGTALPETIIPVIAVLFLGTPGANAVGVGAILGAPFMLATLGFSVTGAAVLFYARRGRREATMACDKVTLTRDLVFFLLFFGLATIVGFFHTGQALQIAAAMAMVAGYVWYVRCTLQGEGQAMEDCDELYATRFLRLPDHLFCVIAQVVASLVLMIAGAHMFVVGVEAVANAAHLSPLILSLIITPIATELPEKLNSILWVRQKKDILALGNITGAMVFQSSFPVAFGVVFTDWNLDGLSLLSAAIALVMAGVLLISLKITGRLSPTVLSTGSLLYLIYVACIVFWH